MDTNKMRDISREQFEARFPVPAGIGWDECLGRYKVVDIQRLVSTLQIGDHNSRWEGWKASREAVVVELPRITGHEYDPLADADYREGCREAIEAQGLKVTP